ncbi:hypothetical protein GWK47_006535 [Chionoecetes opilio]|uniref:Endonuclease/exonuclease/phosphatase domain-containing protein n=1 Tax=Chionoecetes opilio TaxID=41210 RepID=A0A8J4Y4X7_CHIOP|nr:hypothetical protein GWK47_006535 [Chionoecetes opilio]
MAYSGPATLSDVEGDLAMSDDDTTYDGAFPALQHQGRAAPVVPNKCPVADVLNSSGESLCPASKTVKHRAAVTGQREVLRQSSLQRPLQTLPLKPAPSPPAFAPRDAYVKLIFEEYPSVDTKLRWLAEVNRAFLLDRELAEVKMSAVTSRFVYISRQRMDIVDRKCAWCAGGHDSRTCPHRAPPPQDAAASSTPPPPIADTSNWKCPRCQKPDADPHPQPLGVRDLYHLHRATTHHPSPLPLLSLRREAPALAGYVSYVHIVRNGLIAYVHSTVQHQLLRCSGDPDTTYQLLEVTVGTGKIKLGNVYSAPTRLNVLALPLPTACGMVLIGDFNARHPELGDLSGLRRPPGARSWTLDARILEVFRVAGADGLLFQQNPTPHHLHGYQEFRDNLVALQRCVRTESWRNFTGGINHQTSVQSMWRVINKVIRKKPATALHHSPGELAQHLIES